MKTLFIFMLGLLLVLSSSCGRDSNQTMAQNEHAQLTNPCRLLAGDCKCYMTATGRICTNGYEFIEDNRRY